MNVLKLVVFCGNESGRIGKQKWKYDGLIYANEANSNVEREFKTNAQCNEEKKKIK